MVEEGVVSLWHRARTKVATAKYGSLFQQIIRAPEEKLPEPEETGK